MVESIKYSTIFENILENYNVKNLIVSKSRWNFMKTILLTAKKFNINTVFIPHGLYYDDPLWNQTHSKNILVDGKYFKDILLKRGENLNSLIDFGNLTLSINKDKEIFKEKTDIKIITYFSTVLNDIYDNEIYKQTFRFMINLVKKIDDAKLNIKLHPREDLNLVKSFFTTEEISKVNIYINESDNMRLIKNSDAIFCVNSSIIIEILLFGIKPFLLDFWNSDDIYGFKDDNYVIAISDNNVDDLFEKYDIFDDPKISIDKVKYFNINNINNMKNIFNEIIE